MIPNYYEKYVFTETIKILYLMFNSKASIIFSLDEILENNSLCFYSLAGLSEIIPKK